MFTVHTDKKNVIRILSLEVIILIPKIQLVMIVHNKSAYYVWTFLGVQ